MKHGYSALCAALALSACLPGGKVPLVSTGAVAASVADAAGAASPAVLAGGTVADEKALGVAALAVTAAANGFVALIRIGKFTPGAPDTLAVGNKFDLVRQAINAAAQARSAASYREALGAIAPLLAEIETALAGVN